MSQTRYGASVEDLIELQNPGVLYNIISLLSSWVSVSRLKAKDLSQPTFLQILQHCIRLPVCLFQIPVIAFSGLPSEKLRLGLKTNSECICRVNYCVKDTVPLMDVGTRERSGLVRG